MPSMIVETQPIGSEPGCSIRAIRPATRPNRIQPITLVIIRKSPVGVDSQARRSPAPPRVRARAPSPADMYGDDGSKRDAKIAPAPRGLRKIDEVRPQCRRLGAHCAPAQPAVPGQ